MSGPPQNGSEDRQDGTGGDAIWSWLAGAMLLIAVVVVIAVARRGLEATPAATPANSQGTDKLSEDSRGRVETIVFCESVTRRPNGTMDLSGAFNEFAFAAFPAKVSFVVVLVVRPAGPGHKYEVEFVHPQAAVVRKETPIDPWSLTVHQFEVPDMTVAGTGTFAFRVLCDGHLIGERRLSLAGPVAAATLPTR